MADDAEPRTQTRPFADWLRDHKRGDLHDEISRKFADLAIAVVEREKVGTLSLKLKVSPNKDGVTVFVEDILTIAQPPLARGGTTFYVDEEGNMSRTDPRQLTIDDQPLRVVETKAEEPVVVNTGTGEVRSID